MLEIISKAVTDDLTELPSIKTELRILTDDDDLYLEDLIHRASAAIAAYCGRTTFGRETYRQAEWTDGPLLQIFLDRDLDIEVSMVTLNGVALPSTDWLLEGRRLRRMLGARPSSWPGGSSIVIEYQAGFHLLATLPRDIEQACITLVKDAYHARDRDRALRSERVLDLSEVSFFGAAINAKTGGLPPDIAAQVDGYVLMPVKLAC